MKNNDDYKKHKKFKLMFLEKYITSISLKLKNTMSTTRNNNIIIKIAERQYRNEGVRSIKKTTEHSERQMDQCVKTLGNVGSPAVFQEQHQLME